ncbi:MAG: tetratricopeptide repeat protein [Rhodospirillales bacterium]|nr:tetratricopeptide repeat protein [Rhodospirillales bacterium]
MAPSDEIEGDAEALHQQGAALHHAGKAIEALVVLEQAAEQAPDSPAIIADLGVLYHLAGNLDAGEARLRSAIELDPKNPEYYFNLARLLSDIGNLEEAEECYRVSIELQPDFAAAHNNLGNLLKAGGRYSEAEVSYRLAIAADGSYTPAYRNLADGLEMAGDPLGAEQAYAIALHLRGDTGTRIRDALVLPVIASSVEEIDAYRRRIKLKLTEILEDAPKLTDPLAEVGATNFQLAYHGQNDRDLQSLLAQVYEAAAPSLLYRAPHCGDWLGGMEGGPTRIGFVSSFFHEHTIARLNIGLIEGLPRPEFEVHVFSFSTVVDAMSGRVEAAADCFTRLPADLELARAEISAAELDFLYYTDIGMEPLSYFLAFSKLAPIQCVGWGHPVTTGIGAIDYFISSHRIESKNADAAYSEKLVRLDDLPSLIADPAHGRGQGAGSDGRQGNIICPQSLFKYHPDFDAILGGILRANPAARISLIGGSRDSWTNLLDQRIRRGLADVADRIEYQPRMGADDYFAYLSNADVVLDTPHFSGGMTTNEALSVGAPVVTLPGEFMRGRVSLGIYRQMGWQDCVAENSDDYVAIVTRLLNEPAIAKEARDQIAENRHKLIGNKNTIKQHVKFFERTMFEH